MPVGISDTGKPPRITLKCPRTCIVMMSDEKKEGLLWGEDLKNFGSGEDSTLICCRALSR